MRKPFEKFAADFFLQYEGTKLGQGRDAVKNLLLDNPELMDEIEQKILGVITGAPAPQTEEESAA